LTSVGLVFAPITGKSCVFYPKADNLYISSSWVEGENRALSDEGLDRLMDGYAKRFMAGRHSALGAHAPLRRQRAT